MFVQMRKISRTNTKKQSATKQPCLFGGKKFPDITDRKQLFVLITKEEHMRRVAENEKKQKLKIAKNEERVRKSPKKGKFSGTEGEQPDLLELFKGHFLTDQDVVSKAKNESLPEKIDINHHQSNVSGGRN
jgi:hypothetical protein